MCSWGGGGAFFPLVQIYTRQTMASTLPFEVYFEVNCLDFTVLGCLYKLYGMQVNCLWANVERLYVICWSKWPRRINTDRQPRDVRAGGQNWPLQKGGCRSVFKIHGCCDTLHVICANARLHVRERAGPSEHVLCFYSNAAVRDVRRVVGSALTAEGPLRWNLQSALLRSST